VKKIEIELRLVCKCKSGKPFEFNVSVKVVNLCI